MLKLKSEAIESLCYAGRVLTHDQVRLLETILGVVTEFQLSMLWQSVALKS